MLTNMMAPKNTRKVTNGAMDTLARVICLNQRLISIVVLIGYLHTQL